MHIPKAYSEYITASAPCTYHITHRMNGRRLSCCRVQTSDRTMHKRQIEPCINIRSTRHVMEICTYTSHLAYQTPDGISYTYYIATTRNGLTFRYQSMPHSHDISPCHFHLVTFTSGFASFSLLPPWCKQAPFGSTSSP